MNIGIDIGYSAVKAISGDRRVTFPSVVGSPDLARFGLLDGEARDIVLASPSGPLLVGGGAVEQSRFVARREDRAWIDSGEFYALFLAALSELSPATSAGVALVTGLPVAFYGDRGRLASVLNGEHRVARLGRRAQVFHIVECRVVPQPFGALLSLALDERGRVADASLAGRAGVIDIGAKTTNILSVSRLRTLERETASVNAGGWDVVRAVRDYLSSECPGLDLRDHQLAEAIVARRITYYGEPVDLGPVVEPVLEALAGQVIATATQLWNGGAGLDAVVIAGGGALLLGERITRHAGFRRARVAPDPVFANALGFWKLSQRPK